MSTVRWFVPKSIQRGSHDEYQRALLAVKFALGIGTLTAGFSAVLWSLNAPVLAGYDLAVSIVVCLSPFAMWFTGSVDVGCHVLVTSIFIMLAGLALLGGGMTAPTVPVLVMAPMVALFLSDRVGGYIWTAIVLAFLAITSGIEALGYEFPIYLDEAYLPFVRTSVYVTLVINVVFFVLLYEQGKRQALEQVNTTNKRMARMIVHVEATSQALSRSAAEFFGPDLSGQRAEPDEPLNGLTQQMMATASTGRAIIDSVGQSMHGMIRQYNQISERIRELHEQSGTIANMVQTIDNVSGRLDLMALNTGIEAANAGIEGKRFMLIADDMRRLALRVTAETRQINAAIRRVYKHTDAAMEASRIGQSLTDDGGAELERMSQAFDDMYQLIERTAEASKRVTHDTESQIAAIHELASASSVVRDSA